MRSFRLFYCFLFACVACCLGRSGSCDELSESAVSEFLKAHCVKCHNEDESKGDISLVADGSLFAEVTLETWGKVFDVLDSGEMPPQEEPQLGARERKAVAAWVRSQLRSRVKAQKHTTARRLTNVEYENTITELIGFRLKLIDRLSKDPEQPYSFNNTAEFMRLGPEQIDRYLECARLAMRSAIVDSEKPKVHKTRREWKSEGADRGLGIDEIGIWGNRRGSPAGGMGLRTFPKTGEYRIRIKASAILPHGYDELPLRLVMGYGGLEENQSTHRIESVGTILLTKNPDDAEVYEFRGRIENHPVRPPRASRNKVIPESMAITPQNLFDDGTLNDDRDFARTRNIAMPRAVVHWMEFEAPIVEVWPPAHHTRILFDSPLRQSDPPAYVKQVLHRFMSRAYRRPATAAEIERFANVYELVLPELKTLEAAMRETLAMVLISPQFLYHSGQQTSQYELASRMSYFLWASMPDDELLKLAADNRLSDPDVIAAQVTRMLADKRSESFVQNFTTQWLSLEKMHTVAVNRDLFPRFLYYVPRGERAGTEEPYRPTIRDYLQQETVGFVAELIRRNAPALQIVDSDFAYLNQPLAAHYGVDGVTGNTFRPVPITQEHHLGGLLTQGSVLLGNSTGSAPHPIYRAVWLREAILGDEVADPPAEVPALSDSAGESAEEALSIKDLLVKHREVESCHRCHSRLDPWGVAFERYNAIGQFQPKVPRDGTRVSPFNAAKHKDLKGYAAYLDSICTVPIDASSRLPHGPEVDGMRSLKDFLLKHRKQDIAQNVIRRLLTYAIGRELTVHDSFAVEDLVKQTEANEYRLQDIIVAICQSETFSERKP